LTRPKRSDSAKAMHYPANTATKVRLLCVVASAKAFRTHRDTQAIHAKLDELLRVEGRARSELTELDDEEPEVIKERRLPEHSMQPSTPPS
jgi:low affinity Fe/Cu permease